MTVSPYQEQFRIADFQQEPGAPQAATLTGLIHLLASAACRGRQHGAKQSTLLDMKITFFPMQACETIDGETRIAMRNGPVSLWESELRTGAGALLAKATHTLLSASDIQSGSREGAHKAQPGETTRKRMENGLAEDRRELIAAAAAEIIADKGFAAASMREIAAAAGMHVPTMYQYVNSKEEVLELVYRWVIQRVRTNIGPAFDEEDPARPHLTRVVDCMIDNIDVMRRETGVLNREMRSLSRPARQRVVDDYAEIIRQIADVISAGMGEGKFRDVDPVLAANFIDAICDTWGLRRFAYRGYDIEQFKKEVNAFVELGLAKP